METLEQAFQYAEQNSKYSYWSIDMLRFLRVLDEFRGLNNLRILEIGCGYGLVSKFLDSNNHVIAVDLADNEKFFEGRDNIEFIQMKLGEELPCAENSVDLVIANEVFEHVVDLDSMLKDIHRVLRPGGRVQADVPALYLNFVTIALGSLAKLIRLFYKPSAEKKASDSASIRADSFYRRGLLGKTKQFLINYLAQADYCYREHVHFHNYPWWEKQFCKNGFSMIETSGISIFRGVSLLGKQNFLAVYLLERKISKNFFAKWISSNTFYIFEKTTC